MQPGVTVIDAKMGGGSPAGGTICLYLDPSRLLRWHQWLASALSHHRVSFLLAPTAHPLPRACLLAMALERMIYGLHNDHAIDDLDLPHGAPLDGVFDVVINLAGHDCDLPAGRRVLTPLFNSIPGEIGAIAALLDEAPVRIDVHDSTSTAAAPGARPALADPQILLRALDGVLSRAVELIVKTLNEPSAIRDCDNNRTYRQGASPAIPRFPVEMARIARVLAGKIVKRIGQIATGGNTWATAYRLDHGSPLFDARRASFHLLPDDGQRYYADPFPFQHNEQNFIFVEEFPFATQRGCISVAQIDERGLVTRPRIVLEESHHLSFPFVFENDGQIWMIPEAADCGRIDLYRADGFPYRWQRVGSLLEGIAAYDATLLRHNSKFWLLASLGQWQSTSWDNLSIFHAPRIDGPWTSHAHNPVLLDAMSSRAAGAPFQHNGCLLRPVQDCSQIYGGAITLNRVDHLSEAGFQQTALGRIECGTPGCHTYNRRGQLEVVDIFAPTRGLTDISAAYTPIPQSRAA